MIVLSMASDSLAQTAITFARGRTSATINGTIVTDGVRTYTVRGRAGQRISVTVRSGNNYVFAGIEAIGAGRTLTGVLPYSSSYVIQLDNGGNATNFTMTVSIR